MKFYSTSTIFGWLLLSQLYCIFVIIVGLILILTSFLLCLKYTNHWPTLWWISTSLPFEITDIRGGKQLTFFTELQRHYLIGLVHCKFLEITKFDRRQLFEVIKSKFHKKGHDKSSSQSKNKHSAFWRKSNSSNFYPLTSPTAVIADHLFP